MLAAPVPPESIHLNHLIGLSEEPGGVRLQFERGDEVLTGIVVGASGPSLSPSPVFFHAHCDESFFDETRKNKTG